MGLVQQEIKKLHELTCENSEYVNKAKEVLKMFLNQERVYTIQSTKNNKRDLIKRQGKIFCGINELNEPCIWLFSEEDYSKAYAEHFGFKINEFFLIKSLTIQDLERIIFKAMFKGVKTIRIDEGATYLNVCIYDFLNGIFEVLGKDPIIKNTDRPIINYLLETRYKNRLAYVIKTKNRIGQRTLFELLEESNINSETVITKEERLYDGVVIDKNTLNIYLNNEDAKKAVESMEDYDAEIEAIGFNELEEVIKDLSDNNLECQILGFVSGENAAEINIKKALLIMENMK